MIRVLIADDSLTARLLIRALLEGAGDFTVVGEASDGAQAVSLCEQLKPDVVTMDLSMPRLDGFDATKEIMIKQPTPIVIVSSVVVDSLEAEAAVRALRAGAVAVLHKPAGPGHPGFDDEAQAFVATVRAMADVKVVRHFRASVAFKPASPQGAVPLRGTHVAPRLVAVAASTGGPAALHAVLSALPAQCPLPILVVQHITSGFTEGLCAWLRSVCPLAVKVAQAGETLQGRTVYVAPDDFHLGVGATGRVELSPAPAIGGFRPSATALFRSAAKAFGGACVGVILSGMGEDGVDGLRAIHAAGGRVIAQDEKTSVVFGMPGAAVRAKVVDFELPLERIAAQIVALV
jgi:two-component system chemotaxis response regulator CheB